MRECSVTSRTTMPSRAALSIWCAAVLLLCGSGPALADFNLPDSGQTSCYGVVSCAGSGQDGAYPGNPLSYTDNGNGTVTDNNTHLVWQKGSNTDASWTAAVLACAALGSGYRLPSRHELVSIVNYGVDNPGPTISSVFTPTYNTMNWASETMATNSDWAWGVHFRYGNALYYTKSSPMPFRCVKDEITP